MKKSKVSLIALLLCLVAFPCMDYAEVAPLPTPDVRLPLANLPDFVPIPYRRLVTAVSAKYHVPVRILARLIYAESRWNPWARGHNENGTTDLGLCQLNDKYLDDYAWRYNKGFRVNPFVPADAVAVACAKLSELHQRHGNWHRAVVAWNCGSSRAYNPPALSVELADFVVGRR